VSPAGLRGLLRAIPVAARVCAVVAFANAACWSIATPAFQGADEQAHFAYTQVLAQTGKLPSSSAETFSPEEDLALTDEHFREVVLNPTRTPLASRRQARLLQHDLALHAPRHGNGAAGVAVSQPPLYYALQSIPYALGAGGTLLDRLELMRLFSALLAGITALFVFLFLREALPAAPWAWTAGALAAALAPLLGFTSSAVNPDALLLTVSAAIFCVLARAFRHGLTRRLALALGALLAAGFLTKLNFLGLAPGVFVGLALLTRRQARAPCAGSGPYRAAALAVAIALTPVLAYVARNLLTHRAGLGLLSNALHATAGHGSITAEISYVWQLYLPRLPGMTNDFPGISTTFQIWFKGFVGRYNWLETVFPNGVYDLALLPAATIGALSVRALWLGREALRARLPELATYVLMTGGVMTLTAADSYLMFPNLDAGVSEPRYMMPMLALGAAVLALAARGAGRRFGRAAGALIVLLILTHNAASLLLEISRYYG
jgi:4-amino-4-deoxy-L-arabinose transferase-like glycosyltransferase